MLLSSLISLRALRTDTSPSVESDVLDLRVD